MSFFRHQFLAGAAALAVGAVVAVSSPSVASAASCPTDAEVKAQVAALVAQLRADVPSKSARAATAKALLETRRALRGDKARTPAERAAFGQAIAALARQLRNAQNAVARRAILTQIHALQEQKERGGLTTAERAQLKADNAALRRAVVAKLDTAAEIRSVTVKFRNIHRSFTC